ncbi:MAG: sigma-70 family RNA polymerase sigma factor, partial [Planctomycetota bacterium]|nr:sigma-70 family RNA polymerase sigma factor [Planctomycetota bacterium]
PEAVEDIIQEAFFKIFKNAGKYKRTAKFTTWMFKIATNLALNELRRRRLHSVSTLDAEVDEEGTRFVETLSSDSDAPWEKLNKEELQTVIAETLEALPPDCRAVLLLCDMEEMSYQQVAEVLGIKCGTVGSRLCRARQLFTFYFTRRCKSFLR